MSTVEVYEMAVRIILIMCMYPVLPIMYFMLENEIKPKKNIVLGVTLPYSEIYDPKVKMILASFKRELKSQCLVMALIPVLTFFVKWFSIYFTIMIIWVLLVIMVPYIPYIKYHRKLKIIKNETNSIGGTLEKKTEPDNEYEAPEKALEEVTTLIKSEKPLNQFLFIPPVIFSFFPLIYETFASIDQPEYGWILFGCGTFTIVTLLGVLFQRIIYKQKAEIVDEDKNINVMITRIRRYYWSKFWLMMTWLSGIFSIVFWMFITGKISNILGLVLMLIYSAAIIYVAMQAEFATRHMQQKLSAESTHPLYLDEDDYWIYGLFYYNPQDKKKMVNNRVGIGTTMNLAHKTGKIITVISLACILALPVTCFFVIKEEFTPLTAEFLNNRIVVTHTTQELVLPTKDIESAEIIDDLPSTSKIVGTNMENLLKGTFNVSGYGRCRLYLNPKHPPFLVMTTDEGLIIINANENIVEKIRMQNLLN